MPNWTFNTLTLTGTEEDISKVKAQLNQTFEVPSQKPFEDEIVMFTNTDPVLSFWNIIAPTDLDNYPLQPGITKNAPDNYKSENTWYNWNCSNWGCKWDASAPRLKTDEPNNLQYTFDTPWGAPIPAIEKLAEQYPNLLVEMFSEYEEGGTEYLKWNEQEELV